MNNFITYMKIVNFFNIRFSTVCHGIPNLQIN